MAAPHHIPRISMALSAKLSTSTTNEPVRPLAPTTATVGLPVCDKQHA